MLGLTLREEFQGKRLKGTLIELSTHTQIPATEFLKITYPTADVLKAVEAIGPASAKPLVLIGERGQGKSHLLTVVHHALVDPDAANAWLHNWSRILSDPSIANFALRPKMHVISESLHRQHYKYLWDLLFDKHPHGDFIRGKWMGRGDKKTDVPDDELILELLRKQPTAILLDEFQTWYDGLTDTAKLPAKKWAFNFIQILSEIANNHPDLLVFIVSVRDGNSEAYKQIHRVDPARIDFKGPSARKDRLRLLIHRLFENRTQVAPAQIQSLLSVHISEYLRLANIPATDHDKVREEFLESWPFAPHLMRLLEDQVLVATEAQETRDLIRILVDIFKNRSDTSPVITAADFSLEDERSGIAALLDSVSNKHHAALREKALRNLEAVRDAISDPNREVPNLTEIISSLWLRSLAVGNAAGADPATLQIDLTRDRKVDQNGFEVQLNHIVGNGWNIHPVGNRFVFREDENADAKLKSAARNDKLFQDGSDLQQLARQVRYVIGGADEVARTYRVIALGKNWSTNPWKDVEPSEQPDEWDDRIPILVVPESPDKIEQVLGEWLKKQIRTNRNTIRFVLPRQGLQNLFYDREPVILARAVLKAQEWRQQEPEYGKLCSKYESDLRNLLKERFDRFAILATWNFEDPNKCSFHVVTHGEKGSKIPDAVDTRIKTNLFVPEEFEQFTLNAAQHNTSIAHFLRELKEPRPAGKDCIPWLGEVAIKDKLTRMCAAGQIAINVRGLELVQLRTGEERDVAWNRMKGKIGTGKHLEETQLLLPQATPESAGSFQPTQLPITPPHSTPPTMTGSGFTADSETSDLLPAPSSLFATQAATAQLTPRMAPATSPVNLLGKVESWGIGAATNVKDLTVRVPGLTGSQLQKLLKNLPDGLTYEISLDQEV